MPLFYQNVNGERIRFDSDGNYRLLNVEGLGGLEWESRTARSPFQDGRTFIETVAKPREIELTFAVFGNTNEEVNGYFADISRIMSPKLGEGLIEFDYGGKIRGINVVVEQSPVYLTGDDNRTKGYIRSTVSMVANNPYWLDQTITTEELQTWVDTYELPMEMPYEIGVRGDSGTVTNGGDVDTPLLIEVSGGFAPPLTLSNLTTGEDITITKALAPDERLFIDTTPSAQRVTFLDAANNPTNGFHFLDPASRLFQLATGANEIKVNAQDSTTVYINYKRQYISF